MMSATDIMMHQCCNNNFEKLIMHGDGDNDQ